MMCISAKMPRVPESSEKFKANPGKRVYSLSLGGFFDAVLDYCFRGKKKCFLTSQFLLICVMTVFAESPSRLASEHS